MKSIQLTEANATLRLEGDEATRSMDIRNVEVKEWPSSGGGIKLTVFDEKDIPIYNQVMKQGKAKDDGAITVDKRFVFYDHLAVRFEAEKPESKFTLVINFD
ncbi:hypothetical protein [Pontibacter anaerobius]|uniref:Uncharacterized protein n=1 Tax=Pontibacter anaerobius TaxID=2993940 RepID=A0ABT3RG91_9BACT|nr:hypothetical protein [Pontibacter anaerobius]MCX2740849.1 hypothetical protein [Pontibacter anaerobius]